MRKESTLGTAGSTNQDVKVKSSWTSADAKKSGLVKTFGTQGLQGGASWGQQVGCDDYVTLRVH